MVRYYRIRYPGFVSKALTLSYDDGTYHDARMMQILDKYGIKCTFNLNSGAFAEPEPDKPTRRQMNREECVALYTGCGHEIAAHTVSHPDLTQLPAGTVAWEVIRDREELENTVGTIIRGMAYPFGTTNDDVVEELRRSGIVYSRTVESHHGFELPQDWLRLGATCHHKDPMLDQLCDKFLAMNPVWKLQMFYLWGHSYEFEEAEHWELLENFCKKMGGRQDIWYATNIEIYDYLQAAHRLQASADGKRVYNPTAIPVYIRANRVDYVLQPGTVTEIG